MIKLPLLLMFTFLFTTSSIGLAQEEIAPFVWKKHKPLRINEKNLLLLTNRTWTTYRQYQIIQDTASIRSGNFIGFKLTADGQLEGSMGKKNLNGTWKQNGKKALAFTVIDSNDFRQYFIQGNDYAIYKLDETELVLIESQKNGAARTILYCKGNKVNIFAEPYQPNPITPAAKTDPKELEMARE
jgi:hypothetical protein